MSLKIPRTPPFFFGFSSDAMEVIFLLLPELLAPRHVTLPGGDLGDHIREQPERVHRREHRYADQVTHRHHHEDRLHLMPHLDGMTGELVPGHAVHEPGNSLPETRQTPDDDAAH